MLRGRHPTGSKLVSESQYLDQPAIRDERGHHGGAWASGYDERLKTTG
jgi:hypothetical protein